MKSKRLFFFIVLVIAFLPLVYLAVVWQQIPQQVPLHFNARFLPDRTGNKSELWVPAGILAGVSVLLYLLLRNIQLLDPKRRGKPVSGVYTKLAFVMVLFMAALNFVIIISAIKGGSVLQHLLFPLLGLLFVFVGNYMNNIKPNYFAGYRLPWTLSDDNNWK